MSGFGDPIVLGYIATPEGEAALERAIAEAKLRDALLVVVHSQLTPGDNEVVDGIEVDETMDPVSALLMERAVRFETRQVAEGRDPADDVISVAEEVDADLIVIGLHKHTHMGKLIMGSNAHRILLNATCAVLAVKSADRALSATPAASAAL